MGRKGRRLGRWALCTTLLLTGCWTLRPGSERIDAGELDAAADGGKEAGADAVADVVLDSGPADSGAGDAGAADSGPMDTGPVDTGSIDTGPTDTGPRDTGLFDSGATDTGPSDTGPSDTGPGDAGGGPCDSACPGGQTCIGGGCTPLVPVMLAAASSHTCALMNSGIVYCWGVNASGQLGNAITTDSVSPVLVRDVDDGIAIEAGGNHTCVRRRSGLSYCWGVVRGWMSSTGIRSTPMTFAGALDAVSVSLGATNSCAVLPGGTMICGGTNARGDVGDGTMTERMMPVAVMGMTDAVSVSAGGNTNYGHVCAVRRGGTVSCWGNNQYGQLGDGTTTHRPTPVAVPGLGDVVEVAAGFDHTCARLSTGAVRCWGRNHNGQLGDTTTNERHTPGGVPGVSDAVQISTGSDTNCVRRAGGQVLCWGGNNNGQIGNGTTGVFATSPATVTGLADAVSVTVGPQHVCALRRSGRAACWGQNTYGQLGTRDTVSRSTPVDIVLP